MLNKGLRDEESTRIDNVLKVLMSIGFLPKFWNIEDTSLIDNELTSFGLSVESMVNLSEQDLITLLVRCHLDWNQLELFGDFLVRFSVVDNYNFSGKAIAIYEYVQQESKTFSFGIISKIASAKANL
ncbi:MULTISPECIES: hypothetical protein [Flavobacterium]|jgi:hypothetical protein|uniref:Uncharacterized protein n=1 Tax=Flavobacterium hydatis TaxID=991 RepID=A0A086AS16_FLAHY|nr:MULTISPECIES: hypothetical protein [Flavobacterium]KFF19480.1 hypothetical protein IW20_03080 [Flavobacterium hydatis]KIA97700.1 hypothetical protein OA93_11960 [Flavobacterium sp. KMS]OUL60815.1 hypothetical protein B8T70_18390 [Flavobacterium sp. AJR]OXA96388.1 hypothetical protein B0A62_03740 [Flavobacterium hydatis]